MLMNEYKNSLSILFGANLVPLTWGYHGIGKTTALEQLAAEGGHLLVNYRLGNVEAGELLGIPAEVTDQYSGQKVATRNLMPEWLKTMITFCNANPDKWGILHVDELNHIRKDMQSFIFQIALDKRLHETVFPPNLKVACSANPPTDDYSGVFDFSNKALLSRFIHIKLAPTVDEWLEFARGTGIHEDIVQYVTMNPDKLDPVLQPFSVDEYASRNRRSYDFLSRLLKAGASRELLAGAIGSVNVIDFFRWMDENRSKTISADEILNDYAKVRPRILELQEKGKVGAISSISASVAALVDKMPEQSLLGKKVEVDNLVAYTKDLSPELAWAFMSSIIFKAAIHYGPDVAGAPTKEPGSVFGPHTYPELRTLFKSYVDLGIAKKAEETPAEEEGTVKKTAKKKKKA